MKITVRLTQDQHDHLARRVAQGDYLSIDAAVSAAIDNMVRDEAVALSALENPALVEEIRRRASDPPEMFEAFDADEMMAWLDARATARKKGSDAA